MLFSTTLAVSFLGLSTLSQAAPVQQERGVVWVTVTESAPPAHTRWATGGVFSEQFDWHASSDGPGAVVVSATTSIQTAAAAAAVPTTTTIAAAPTTTAVAAAPTTSVTAAVTTANAIKAVVTTSSVAANVKTSSTTPVAAAASTTAASTTTSSSFKKAGVAWGQCSAAVGTLAAWVDNRSWYYDWASGAESTAGSMEYVPMLYGLSSGAQFATDSASWPSSVTHVLGYNEPDGYQAISASAAITNWNQYMGALKTAKPNMIFVTPACTNADEGTWITEFMAGASPKPTVLALHWYGLDASAFQTYVEGMHTKFPSMNIWVTEVGVMNFGTSPATPPASQAAVTSFLTSVGSFLNSASYVERWAFYGQSNDFSDTGSSPMSPYDQFYTTNTQSLSALGQQYAAM